MQGENMIILNQNNSRQYTQLQTGLSEFGLSPNDWSLEPKDNNFMLIKNKSEKNFYFIGKTTVKKNSEQLDWQFITLASL